MDWLQHYLLNEDATLCEEEMALLWRAGSHCLIPFFALCSVLGLSFGILAAWGDSQSLLSVRMLYWFLNPKKGGFLNPKKRGQWGPKNGQTIPVLQYTGIRVYRYTTIPPDLSGCRAVGLSAGESAAVQLVWLLAGRVVDSVCTHVNQIGCELGAARANATTRANEEAPRARKRHGKHREWWGGVPIGLFSLIQ